MKTNIKIISVLLAVIMTMAVMPVFTFAETEEAPILYSKVDTPFTDYYGRSVLAAMENSTALLYAYDQIAAGVEASASEISVYNGVDVLTEEMFHVAFDAYLSDYAHHFWLAKAYTLYTNGTSIVRLNPEYLMSGEVLAKAKTDFEKAVEQMLTGISSSMSEYERELTIHDRLLNNLEYNAEGDNAHDAYGALVLGASVCEGYAEAFQYLLHRVGIQSLLVVGDADGAHEWNMVRIDGEYYCVDPTWNDQSITFHAYFNVTDDVLSLDHTADMSFDIPECTATDAFYFTVNPYQFDYTDGNAVDILAGWFKEHGYNVRLYISSSEDANAFWEWFRNNRAEIAFKAGVIGSFSSGYRRMGKEYNVYLTNMEATYFVGASLCIGTDLSVKYSINIHDAAAYLEQGDLAVKFTYGAKEVLVKDYSVDGTSYNFTLDGLTPQQMGDKIDASLVVVDEEDNVLQTLCSKNGYSIVDNCKNLLNSYVKDETLVTFIHDLLAYGSAAQNYRNHKSDQPISDLIGIEATSVMPLDTEKKVLSGNENADCRMTSAGVHFNSVNSIYVNIHSVDGSFKVKVGEKEYTAADCEIIDENTYKFRLEALKATDLDTVCDIELYNGEELCATLSYSANAYAYSMANGATSDQKMIDLALALYRYGVSAEAYVEAHSAA